MEIKEAVNQLVRLFNEQQSIDEQVKDIKASLKDTSYNPSLIIAVAKSLASNKTEDLKEKSQDILDIISAVRD